MVAAAAHRGGWVMAALRAAVSLSLVLLALSSSSALAAGAAEGHWLCYLSDHVEDDPIVSGKMQVKGNTYTFSGMYEGTGTLRYDGSRSKNFSIIDGPLDGLYIAQSKVGPDRNG